MGLAFSGHMDMDRWLL